MSDRPVQIRVPFPTWCVKQRVWSRAHSAKRVPYADYVDRIVKEGMFLNQELLDEEFTVRVDDSQ